MFDKRIAEPEFAALIEKKRRRLKTANTAVGGLGCLGLILGLFWLIATIGITQYFGVPALILCLFVIPGVFRLYARTGRYRPLLHCVRVLGIALLAAVWLAPLVCIRFERVPLLYPLKHFVYQAGVRAYPYRETVLPAHLPKQHDDYLFRTEPGMIAQDYHPYEYLFMHTDEAALRSYDERLSGNPDYERKENRSLSQEEISRMIEDGEIYDEEWAEYQNVPHWMYEMLRNDAGLDDDLSQAVIYQHGRNGAVINYETGLLAAWG